MSYSPNLMYFLDRLEGFSTNIFRLETNGADSATANKILRFSLPSNALLNMRSFALHFNATTSENATGARLPAKIDTLIERVEVTAGGIQLSQGLNLYNVLRHAKDAVLGDKTNSVCGHPDIFRNVSYVDGSGITGTSGEVYPFTHKQTQFVIDHWEGFIGTCEPKILDAALLPDLVISIYLADNNVLTTSKGIDFPSVGDGSNNEFTVAGSGGATYTLNNIHATIESIGLADAVYDNMVSSMIQQKGFLEIPFKQYFSFSNQHNGSTRFTVATQSLDRVWVAFRKNGYETQSNPIRVKGYKYKGAFSAISNDVSLSTLDLGQSEYGGLLGTDREKYLGPYYNFSEPTSSNKNTYQLQLNGAYYPQFMATAEEMYALSKNSALGAYNENVKSLQQFKEHYFVMCARLNMPESEFSRNLSGLDTRAVSLNGYFNTMNINESANPNVVIFCETSSTLKVGQGRMIEIST